MKILMWVLIALVCLVGLIVIIGFIAPSTSHVERTHTFKAPKSAIYDQISTMANWAAWSTWDRMDTNMKKTLVGPPSGVGAGYTWSSDEWEVGDGKLNIIAANDDHIVADMFFGASGRPSKATFAFVSDNDETRVTWSIDSDFGMNPFARVMGLFMDTMVGPNFEQSLRNIDSVVKTLPPPVAVREEMFVGGYALTMRVQCQIKEIGSKLALIYGSVMKSAGEQGLSFSAPPFAIYHTFDQAKGIVDMEAGAQLPSLPKATAPLTAVTLNRGKVIVADYYGPYQGSGSAWTAVERYATAHHLVLDGSPWESYVTDPMTEKDSTKWLTRVYYRVK